MDTSKEYIEMCGKSIEIQKEWKCEIGDYYYDHFSQEVEISVRDVSQSIKFQYFTRLPRQDQLQDMVVSKKAQYVNGLPYITFIELFHQFVKKCCHQFNSMEQLWLAFVMHEKYGKRWVDGSDWVVI